MKKIFILFLFLSAITLNAQWAPTSCPVTEAIYFSSDDTALYAATGIGGGFFSSPDSGNVWTAPFNFFSHYIVSVFHSDGHLYLGGSMANLRSEDGGFTWNQMPSLAEESYCFIKFGDFVFSGTFGGGIYRSIDEGNTWSQCNNGLFNDYPMAFAHDATTLYAATSGGLFKSTSYGNQWIDVTASLGSPPLDAVAFDGTYILVGGNYCGIYRSADGGVTWESANSGLPGMDIRTLYAIGKTVFAGCSGGSYYTKDHGLNWNEYNSGFTTTNYIQSYYSLGNILFCGTYSNGIWKRELEDNLVGAEEIPEPVASICPNPTAGNLTVSISENAELTVRDIFGKEILKRTLSEKHSAFTLEKDGIYLAEIKTKKGVYSKKIIVLK